MRGGRRIPGVAAVLMMILAGMTVPLRGQSITNFSWVRGAEIVPGRYYHTMQVLPDQRILVTGGRKGRDPLQSMRVFDPSAGNGTGAWTDLPDMFDRRERHQATLMPAGWMLISGGLDQVPINRVELFDPVTLQQQRLPDMNDVRYEHSATYLGAGRVLVVGSKDYDRGLPTCEIFETLETSTTAASYWRWRRTASLQFGRGRHCAVRLLDGRVLVIGGVYNYAPTITCELFDPATETWSLAASMHVPRESHTATLLPDGRVLVVGGDMGGAEISSCEIFDPTKNAGKGEWSMLPNSLIPRKNHTATLIRGRFLLIAGAWRIGQGDTSTEYLDILQQPWRWVLGPAMLVERSNHSASLLADGRIMLVGGEIQGTQEATSACDLSGISLRTGRLPLAATIGIDVVAPNPFTDLVSITVVRPTRGTATLDVLDAIGSQVRSLTSEIPAEGRHTVSWDGRDETGRTLPPGLYFLQLRAADILQTRPLLLMR